MQKNSHNYWHRETHDSDPHWSGTGNELLQNMSLIQASYDIEGHGQGTIALLGPSSMPYSRMFGLMDAFRRELAMTLADYYRTLDAKQ